MKTTNSTQILAINLRRLLDSNHLKISELHTISGVSDRMIRYALKGERAPTTGTLDKLAKPFGIDGWQLLLPNLSMDRHINNRISDLVRRYLWLPEEGRAYLDMVSERESRYRIEGDGDDTSKRTKQAKLPNPLL